MYIVFNSSVSGLGNNGGSRTILYSAEILRSLGHKVDIITGNDNFTWFNHPKPVTYVPTNIDLLINVAAVDMENTFKIEAKHKAWYIRAHETWAMSEEQLIRLYKLKDIINIVNSKGLQKQLEGYGISSEVIYQGIDFNLWNNEYLRPEYTIRIGCLHTKQHRKRWKDFVKLHSILGDLEYDYVGIGNALPKETFLTDFKLNASPEELRDLYSSCHIWFAPTDNEGLHNVPMEANLCGCLVVCSDHPLNGMIYDYAEKKSTAMIYPFGNIEKAVDLIRKPEWYKINNMQLIIKSFIGTREDNMKKLINIFGEK